VIHTGIHAQSGDPAGGAHRRVGTPETRRPARESCARDSLAAATRPPTLGSFIDVTAPLAVARTAYALLGLPRAASPKLAWSSRRRRPIEIVSVDSALVYRGMDIGTAKRRSPNAQPWRTT